MGISEESMILGQRRVKLKILNLRLELESIVLF